MNNHYAGNKPSHPHRLIRVFARHSMGTVVKVPMIFHTDSEDSDQTEWMERLI